MHNIITVTLNPAIDRTVTVPGFAAGEVNRAIAVHDTPGGKGVNVAAALARAAGSGKRIMATGFLGADNRAAFDAFLKSLGIENLFISLPGSTRIGIKIVNPDIASTTDLNFPGLAPSPAALAALNEVLLPPLPPNAVPSATTVRSSTHASFYVLAGSLPPGVPASAYADWTRALRARGACVAIDTSGEALAQALPASPTFIKPNITELSALLGHQISDTNDIATAARTLCERHGIALAVVSMGANGACFVTPHEARLAHPPVIAVHSTVGAGDAMVAGIVHAMTAEDCHDKIDTHIALAKLDDIARLATAFSLSVLTRPDSPATFREGLAHYAPQVTISRIG